MVSRERGVLDRKNAVYKARRQIGLDLSWVYKHPFECCWEVSRGGELEPCDAVAVAVVRPPDDELPFAVCANHVQRARRHGMNQYRSRRFCGDRRKRPPVAP